MKRIFLIALVLLFFFPVIKAQDNRPIFLKHEIALSYGIMNLPNGIGMNVWKGGFTTNYMYRVFKWFSVGINANWQFPADTEYYLWREYYTDGSYQDFENATNYNYFCIAPEIRISFVNTKWATMYFAYSQGYGIYDGNDYLWGKFWNLTLFGGNFHIGRNQKYFVGGEFGIGFKGLYSIHFGYRF